MLYILVVDDVRSTNTGGMGLGLAIAKEIVTLQDGQISMQSESGKTVFNVDIYRLNNMEVNGYYG